MARDSAASLASSKASCSAGFAARVQDEVEPVAQVVDDGVVVRRHAVPSVVSGGGSSDEHGIRHQFLKVRRGFEDFLQALWQFACFGSVRRHVSVCISSDT